MDSWRAGQVYCYCKLKTGGGWSIMVYILLLIIKPTFLLIKEIISQFDKPDIKKELGWPNHGPIMAQS